MSRTKQILNAEINELGSGYPVSIAAFEGPLDLLLHLITKNELDINAISLMEVTESYLATIAKLEELKPGALADFLVVASRLLYIKSHSLLPRPLPPDDVDDDDPGDALIRQLIEYRHFKRIAESLQERETLGLRAYVRMASGPQLDRRLDMSDLDLEKLHKAVRKALQRMPSDPPMPRLHAYPVTVAEQIENVRAYIQRNCVPRTANALHDSSSPVTFVDLLTSSKTRMEVIVTFLAVLELIKQREIQVLQEETFGEILIAPCEPESSNGENSLPS